MIALGIGELLWSWDASNPWLRTAGLWLEDTGQRKTVGGVGWGSGGWAEPERKSILWFSPPEEVQWSTQSWMIMACVGQRSHSKVSGVSIAGMPALSQCSVMGEGGTEPRGL